MVGVRGFAAAARDPKLGPNPRYLEGRVAMVTGGASGMGRAMALAIASRGGNVAPYGWRPGVRGRGARSEAWAEPAVPGGPGRDGDRWRQRDGPGDGPRDRFPWRQCGSVWLASGGSRPRRAIRSLGRTR